jgi:protein-S-isoprenylcysteine O-methyltransferase Ste14
MAGGSAWLSRWRVRVGYPLAAVFVWLAAPTPLSILLGALVAAIGLFIRGAAAGYLRKHQALATAGPYARTRNPLYLGSAFLAAGFAVAGRSWLAAAPLVAYFLLFYPAVMKREEEELRAGYGRAFEEYAARVPLFWPRVGAAAASAAPKAGFSWACYRRNREYQALLGFLAGLVLVWLRMRWRG